MTRRSLPTAKIAWRKLFRGTNRIRRLSPKRKSNGSPYRRSPYESRTEQRGPALFLDKGRNAGMLRKTIYDALANSRQNTFFAAKNDGPQPLPIHLPHSPP